MFKTIKAYIPTANLLTVKVLAWERHPSSNIILTLNGKFYKYTHPYVYKYMNTHIHIWQIYMIDTKSSQAAESVYKVTGFWILQVRYRSFPVTKNFYSTNHLFDS